MKGQQCWFSCDFGNCAEESPPCSTWTTTRVEARADGWLFIPGYGDFCPEHRDAAKASFGWKAGGLS